MADEKLSYSTLPMQGGRMTLFTTLVDLCFLPVLWRDDSRARVEEPTW